MNIYIFKLTNKEMKVGAGNMDEARTRAIEKGVNMSGVLSVKEKKIKAKTRMSTFHRMMSSNEAKFFGPAFKDYRPAINTTDMYQ